MQAVYLAPLLGQFRRRLNPLVTLLSSLGLAAAAALGAEGRTVMSLDGDWEVREGAADKVPLRFDHHVRVPGLVDMAQPPFAEVGQKSQLREVFWYRRAFVIPGEVPPVAMLKIGKAAYGARVFMNGKLAGEHLASFTPANLDVQPFLRGNGITNYLVVRLGAYRDAVPPSVPSGWDFEKTRYIPGIFDSVELTLSSTPHIVRVQAAPDLAASSVRVQAVLRNNAALNTTGIGCTVREARTGKIVGTNVSERVQLDRAAETTLVVNVPIPVPHLWTPEDPFLYEVEVSTGPDTQRARFGMREFRFDPATGRAMLNGRPYFMRGSNVTLYRFFEDAQRGDRPWREDWVRRLHRAFKSMHWNSLRYCIGFPPELWYRIADEEGFLIQDEFPLWHLDKWPAELKRDELAAEYTEWMQERWNHPSVVIWDAQNETRTDETGAAIQTVRGLDLSNRPWDNGWAPAQAPGDCFESHPYLFQNAKFKLSELATLSGVPRGNPIPNAGTNAIIINEYGWLWLNRDGTPTTLTKEVYKNLLGESATPAERRHLYARLLAAKTEFWRAHRACAGVLHFCGLGYSRPDGQTSDHFTDIEKLTFEPEFARYVRDAFSPIGVMIDEWADELPGGETRQFPVVVINDLEKDNQATVQLRLLHDKKVVGSKVEKCLVPALGEKRLSFTLTIPPQSGQYHLEATLNAAGSKKVVSMRDFKVAGSAPAPAKK
jgi:hypothetical protein